jgi:hypothetical protein
VWKYCWHCNSIVILGYNSLRKFLKVNIKQDTKQKFEGLEYHKELALDRREWKLAILVSEIFDSFSFIAFLSEYFFLFIRPFRFFCGLVFYCLFFFFRFGFLSPFFFTLVLFLFFGSCDMWFHLCPTPTCL